MNCICNITFVIDPPQEKDFLIWMRSYAIPKLFNEESPAREPALRKVVDTAGVKPGSDYGDSISLQALFPDEATAHYWDEYFLTDVIVDFYTRFGRDVMNFITFLEVLPL